MAHLSVHISRFCMHQNMRCTICIASQAELSILYTRPLHIRTSLAAATCAVPAASEALCPRETPLARSGYSRKTCVSCALVAQPREPKRLPELHNRIFERRRKRPSSRQLPRGLPVDLDRRQTHRESSTPPQLSGHNTSHEPSSLSPVMAGPTLQLLDLPPELIRHEILPKLSGIALARLTTLSPFATWTEPAARAACLAIWTGQPAQAERWR